MAFFTVYLDDSGTAREHPVASASAIIIPGAQILELDSHWNRFVSANGFSDFHAAACAASKSKDKQYQDWDEKKRNHVFTRVRQFCKKYGVQTFGFSVYKPDFDLVIRGEFRRYTGGHYAWAVRHVLRETETWRRNKKIKEPFQYIFDWPEIGSDAREEIDDLMGQATEWHKRPMHHDFKPRKQTPGLQCVDLIAWITFQLGLNNFHNKPMEGLASESISDFESYYPNGKVSVDKKWFRVPTVLRPALKKWFDVEIAKGMSLSWFRDWYKRHPSREAALNARESKRIPRV